MGVGESHVNKRKDDGREEMEGAAIKRPAADSGEAAYSPPEVSLPLDS